MALGWIPSGWQTPLSHLKQTLGALSSHDSFRFDPPDASDDGISVRQVAAGSVYSLHPRRYDMAEEFDSQLVAGNHMTLVWWVCTFHNSYRIAIRNGWIVNGNTWKIGDSHYLPHQSSRRGLQYQWRRGMVWFGLANGDGWFAMCYTNSIRRRQMLICNS